MGSTSNPAIVGNNRQGSYDAKWASLYSLMDFPQYYPELVQKYGKLFDIFDFLTIAGRTGTCAGHTKTVFSQGSRDRYVSTHVAIATAVAGADITVAIEEWDTSTTTGRSAVQLGEKFAIPGAYCTVSGVKCAFPQWYQITAIAATTANPNEEDTQITAKPLNALTVLAVEVPIGTKLFVSGGNHAPGSAGAKGKTNGWYSETFQTGIKKAAFEIQGSQASNERYTHHLKGGGMGLFSDASIQAEFELDKNVNYDILLGDTADNLTQVDINGVANTVWSTKGIMPHMNASACKNYYTTTFGMADVDNIKLAALSQGITDNTFVLGGGYDFLKGVRNNCLDFIKEYSGGSNMLDNVSNTLKAKIDTIKLGNITLALHEFASFSNPNALGISTYGFMDKAIVFPDTEVTVRNNETGVDMKMKNLSIDYKNFGGENRTRIFQLIEGVNGISQASSNSVANSYDSIQGQYLTEFMLTFLKINQSILIQPDSVL